MRPGTLFNRVRPLKVAACIAMMALLPAPDVAAQVQWRPATAVMITYDRSGSMDFTTQIGQIPDYPLECLNLLSLPMEYARTRHIMAVEALTGSLQGYCPLEVMRPAQRDGRDAEVPWPHTRAHYRYQRSDGLLDAYSDSLFFGFATFDALMDPTSDQIGDYSYGPAFLPNGQITTFYGEGVNLGIANETSPIGGLISPLSYAGFSSQSGSVLAFRLWNNARVQQRIMEVIPALESPLAAVLDDVQVFRHTDPGMTYDPFSQCRPFAHLLITDGIATWDVCRESSNPPVEYRCSEYPYRLAVVEAGDLADAKHCSVCQPGQTVQPIPTYVLTFATDDLDNKAEEIAEAGGTCAILEADGDCVQHAFYAEDHAGLVASLGTIFNNAIGGVMSSIPPLTSTVTGSNGIGLVRFRAGAVVSTNSPYWTGTLTRELYECQPAHEGEEPELTLTSTVDFADWFTPERIAYRHLYFGRPDLTSSCHPDRRDCRFFDYGCGDIPGAVPDPSYDNTLQAYGDGTGGIDSSYDPQPEPTEDAATRSEIDAALLQLRQDAVRRINDDPLPALPAYLDFDIIDTDGDCLIEFEPTLFLQTGMEAFLQAENYLEAGGIVSFVRGWNLAHLALQDILGSVFDLSTIALRDRPQNGYIGDFYHSQMAFSDRPSLSDRTTPGYLEFVNSIGDQSPDPRPYALYIGGNDGMLHAFDALSGEELWGIIPPSFLPHLRETMLSHRVMVDGPVTVKDLRCEHTTESEQWCTLLAVSYRSGGSGVMVLDVTDPRQPKFLFEVTGLDIPELGLGYPRPFLTNMFIADTERPVVVIAGGQPLNGRQTWVESGVESGLAGSHEGEILVIMDALTGEIYRQFDPVSHPDLFRTCGSITGSPSGWSPTILTRAFAGTQYGCLLRFDLASASPLEWTVEIIGQTAYPEEVSFAPTLATRSDRTLVAVYGQGNNEQFENVNQHGSLVSVNEAREFVPSSEDAASGYVLGGVDVNFELMFEAGEFMTTQPIISDGVLYFATWVPDHDDPCNFGSARVYGIDFIGDPTASGSVSDALYQVTVDSDRIVGRLINPLFDPEDPSSDYWVKYIDHTVLGEYSIVFGLNIDLVPSCETVRVNWQGREIEVAAGAVQRRLQVDVVTVGDLTSETGGWVDSEDASNAFSVVSFGEELAHPEIVAVPLDWGVIMEY